MKVVKGVFLVAELNKKPKKTNQQEQLKNAEKKYQSLIEKRNELNDIAKLVREERDMLNEKRKEIIELMKKNKEERNELVSKMKEHKEYTNQIKRAIKTLEYIETDGYRKYLDIFNQYETNNMPRLVEDELNKLNKQIGTL